MTDDEGDLYSPLADSQLDALQAGPDAALYDAVLEAIERILDRPDRERLTSPGLRDSNGASILSTVVMYEQDPRWFVFWNVGPSSPVILGVASLPPF